MSPYLPVPAQGGGGTTYFYYIRELARKHEIHLLCLCRNGCRENSDALRPSCRTLETWPLPKTLALLNCALTLFSRRPFRLAYYYSAKFARRVNELLGQKHFDVVIASHERMGQYVWNAIGVKKIIDFHDVVSFRHKMLADSSRNPLMRQFHSWEASRLARYEHSCMVRFDSVWVSTTAEAEKLKSVDPDDRLRVTSRGIDLRDFVFGLDNSGSTTLIFTGHMSYEPNVDGALYFLREIYGLIKLEIPDAKLQIVGNYPHPDIVRSARRMPDVTVTGRVPSMADYLRRARVFISPLRFGTGVKIKILETLAVGLPVVTTRKGCEGLAVEHERHVLLAETPTEFTSAVKRLFQDNDLYLRLSRNGRAFVEQNYDVDRAAMQLEEILREVSGPRIRD